MKESSCKALGANQGRDFVKDPKKKNEEKIVREKEPHVETELQKENVKILGSHKGQESENT